MILVLTKQRSKIIALVTHGFAHQDIKKENLMANSSQLTQYIIEQPNSAEAKLDLWSRCKYLIAQRPVDDTNLESNVQYFNGRRVIPGPKADPKFGVLNNVEDLQVVEEQYYIRWTDSTTTVNADAYVGQALYTIMTDDEAELYEKYALEHIKKIAAQYKNKLI